MRAKGQNRLESLVLDENKTSILMYLAGTAAALALLSDESLSSHNRRVVAVLIGFLLVGTFVRAVLGRRLTPLAKQLMFVGEWLLITVAAAIGPSVHINLEVLYMWVAVYTALYFPLPLVLAQTGAALLAYLVVLLNGHLQTREIVVSWLLIFGTATVIGAITYGLVSTLKRNSREDELTGLPNRRTWDERFDTEIERARRTGTPLSVISMDIDNFKLVNDREGHLAGDRILRTVAEGLRVATRGGGDIVARLGGDEFGMLVPGSGADQIETVLLRLTETLPHDVVCSIGAATWDGAETAVDLFRRADVEMFKVKQGRKST